MFDGRRFGRLAKANLAESWRSYAWFFGVAIMLHFVYVLIDSRGGKNFTNFTRDAQAGVYLFGLYVFGAIFAARHFLPMAKRESALLAFMRPASVFEKWLLAFLIVCIAFPVVYSLAFYVCDLPAWVWAKYQWQQELVEWQRSKAPAANEFPWKDLDLTLFNPLALGSWQAGVKHALMLATVFGFSMFGSVYFRRMPALKTVLAGFVLLLVLILVSEVFDSRPDLFLDYWETRRRLGAIQSAFFPIVWILLPTLLWLAAYLALREREVA